MKRLVTAALVVVAVCVVGGTALAASGNKSSVIYDSTNPNGGPTNQPSYGPEAYAFKTIGDKITLGGTARSLSNVTVTLSSFACQQGTWNPDDDNDGIPDVPQDCVTQPGATFLQPITLSVFKVAHDGTKGALIATKTQTFDVPYRPSASPTCAAIGQPGKWQTPSKECKNGIADDVTFNFSGEKLDPTVIYEISYGSTHYGSPVLGGAGGPYDSLNVAVTENANSDDPSLWIDGMENPSFDDNTQGWTPAVQFKAGNAN